MRKIDFHIHTKAALGKDSDFEFDNEKLVSYVEQFNLDAVAVTNHNLFDLEQFKTITASLNGKTVVFPGIEIDFEKGHLLLIAENNDLESFENKCKVVEEKCIEGEISLTDLKEIFGDLGDYLLIPHYKKAPEVKSEILEELGLEVFVGEVSSQKKFFQTMKEGKQYAPVYFSDARMKTEMDLELLQGKQTYLNTNANPVTLKSLKVALSDKTKVSLTGSGKNDFFQIFENSQELSGALNVVLGKRSSGKTHFLNRLEKIFGQGKRIKYIKQGMLMNNNEEADFETFLEKEEGRAREDYLKEFKLLVSEVSEIDTTEISCEVDIYLQSLKEYAANEKTHDIFSKAVLYSESLYSLSDTDEVEDLIGAVFVLIKNKNYKLIIDKHLTEENLSDLLKDLAENFKNTTEKNFKKEWVNDLCRDISSELNSQTSAGGIEYNQIDFYDLKLQVERIKKFASVAVALKKPVVISKKDSLGKFSIQTSASPFSGAMELKKVSRNRDTSFQDTYKYYDEPLAYLKKLKEMKVLDKADLYKFFCKVSHKVLNEFDKEVSGGERAEFNLLKELNDALQFEMLFIDEPEASFDNLFLKSDVNKMIKQISSQMPVVVVTHNSTVGMLLEPNYILYTKREIDAKKDEYYLFSGSPGDKEFKTADGTKTEESYAVLLDTLEAGEVSYKDKQRLYGNYRAT